jgi:hypothetical protein
VTGQGLSDREFLFGTRADTRVADLEHAQEICERHALWAASFESRAISFPALGPIAFTSSARRAWSGCSASQRLLAVIAPARLALAGLLLTRRISSCLRTSSRVLVWLIAP